MDVTRVLVVEDEPLSLDLLVENLRFEGYDTAGVASGTEAWEVLAKDPDAFDVILLDRRMPDMDGIEILRRLKGQSLPTRASVIMQTALASEVDIVEGLRAGAYYYLTKPFTSQALLAIVGAAARDRKGYRKLQLDVQQATRGLGCLVTGRFAFRTPEQAWDLAAVLAKTTPQPERAVGGLSELMINAIEHGNLGIGYEEKTRLLEQGRWREEIAQRLSLPQFASRTASICFSRRD
ncbi:MAG TPA: response regulator transcription factor, partial [Holophagaceae bacterium]